MFVFNPGPNLGPDCAPAVFMRSRVPAIVCPWMRVYFKHGPSESTDRRLNHRDYPHSSGNSGHVRARHSRGGGLWSWGRRAAGMAGDRRLGDSVVFSLPSRTGRILFLGRTDLLHGPRGRRSGDTPCLLYTSDAADDLTR